MPLSAPFSMTTIPIHKMFFKNVAWHIRSGDRQCNEQFSSHSVGAAVLLLNLCNILIGIKENSVDFGHMNASCLIWGALVRNGVGKYEISPFL